MKKLLLLTALAIPVISLTGCGNDNHDGHDATSYFHPGQYEAKVDGVHGPMTVRIHVDADYITNVEIHHEDNEGFFTPEAQEELRANAIGGRTHEIDSVSGATGSSNAFIVGLERAIEQARH